MNNKNRAQGLYWLYLLSLLLSLITSTMLSYAVFSTHWEGSRKTNIYISKTFWLSGSIQLDVVREHQPTNLQLEKLTF